MSMHETKRPTGVRAVYPAGVAPVFPLGAEGLGSDIPSSITVSGAGLGTVNGTYAYSGLTGGYPQYTMGVGGEDVCYVRFQAAFGGGAWFVTTVSGGLTDRYRNTSTQALPPRTGWTAVDSNPPPAPTIAY